MRADADFSSVQGARRRRSRATLTDKRRRTLARKRIRFATWLHSQTAPHAQAPPDIALRIALEHLSEKLRVPLLLHYLEGFSIEDTANALRLPVSTIKGRLSRARKSLRESLDEKEVLRT